MVRINGVSLARGQLYRENYFFPVLVPETGSAVPARVSLLISILRLNLVLTYGIPPEFCGGVIFIYFNRHTRRYFQHAHFIPIVGVGKRGAY